MKSSEPIRASSKRGSRTLCELKGVNDRGVVVEYGGATRFHPWSCISTLQLGEVK